MKRLHTFWRYWRTVRHLRVRQIRFRVMRMAKARLCPVSRLPRWGAAPEFDVEALAGLRAWAERWAALAPPSEEAVAALRKGNLSCCGFSQRFERSPEWEWAKASPLARYALHGFGFSRPLAFFMLAHPEESAPDRELLSRWMEDWVAKNPRRARPGWEAFPIAERLLHWAFLAAVAGVPSDAVRRSFAAQADHLRCNLEYDLLANHLMQNAAGLVVAGAVLGNDAMRDDALGVLEREVAEQVLADGGHFERSPMYHAEMLDGLHWTRAALGGRGAMPWLDGAIARMGRFLGELLHPDEDFPLFGDAAFEVAPSTRVLCELSGGELLSAPAPHAWPESGFFALGPPDGGARMLVKAGAPGPDYQLGHAHCDMLSYELTVGKRRVIVDSGVHGYAGSDLRDYCRSTRAHNTVSVNGMEQLECWADFRVGRRYTPRLHYWGPNDDAQVLHAGHNGFAPFEHDRKIIFSREGYWLFADRISGPGSLTAESCIHFHPSVELEDTREGWLAHFEGGPLRIEVYGNPEVKAVRGAAGQGWYCPRFGEAMPCWTLILRAFSIRQVHLGYALFPPRSSTAPRAAVEAFLMFPSKATPL